MKDADLDRLIARAPAPPEPQSHPGDDQLAAFAAQRLSAEEAAKIEVHLAACGDCRDLALELATDLPSGLLRVVGGLFASGRSRSIAVAGGALIAMAAAVAIVVYAPPTQRPPAFDIEGPMGGLAEVRGEADATERFNERSFFEVRVAPLKTPVAPTISCQLYVQREGGLIKKAPDAWQRSEQGVFRYRAVASTIFGDGYGDYAVFVVVGSELPDTPTYRSVEELDAHTQAKTRHRILATYIEKGDAQ